jgi:phospholipase/carboxylesterase
MPDMQTLDGPMIKPASGGAPKQLVVMLHGVGADGNDLIGLAPYYQKVLPEAAFVSPNAPFAFDMAPFGYQWFSLKDMGPEARLKGCRNAAPILDRFLDDMLAETGLAEENLALIGFSQGAMMSLHVGLRRERQLAGIVGYSGMLCGPELLAAEIRSRPPVLLVHGEADELLPVAALGAAVAGLEAAGVEVTYTSRPGLGHGIDDEGLRLGMAFLAEAFDVDLETLREG